MSKILVAEDEPRIASFVAKGLRASGLTPEVVEDGELALAFALGGEFDLLVLDIGLPGLDGFEVLRQQRARGSALPVIILTARDSAVDTIAGLEGGADDYMSKPFSFGELLARIRLRLRTAAPANGDLGELAAGPVTLDLRTRQVNVAGQSEDLSAREFTLLEMFMRHPGQVLTREQVLSHVWGYDFDPGSNVVDVYVRYLRKKLGAERIETVRGVGYRFAPEATTR